MPHNLNLNIGENSTSAPFPTQMEAVDAVLLAYMDTYPDDEDIHDIPEPIDEPGLRSFLVMKRLDGAFQFEITEAPDQGMNMPGQGALSA